MPKVSRVRKSAFRFVVERSVRRALRPAEDGVVVAAVCWAATAAEEEAGLVLVGLETRTFAFWALRAVGADVVVG